MASRPCSAHWGAKCSHLLIGRSRKSRSKPTWGTPHCSFPFPVEEGLRVRETQKSPKASSLVIAPSAKLLSAVCSVAQHSGFLLCQLLRSDSLVPPWTLLICPRTNVHEKSLMSARTASSRSSATRRLFVGLPGSAPLWLPFPATYVRSFIYRIRRLRTARPLFSCPGAVRLQWCLGTTSLS